MAKFKLVIGTKSGKTKQIDVEENNAKPFLGLKIGDKIKGEAFSDMTGYEFQITGGSNTAGFPMRFDVNLAGKKKILLVDGVGIRKNVPGRRIRRTASGVGSIDAGRHRRRSRNFSERNRYRRTGRANEGSHLPVRPSVLLPVDVQRAASRIEESCRSSGSQLCRGPPGNYRSRVEQAGHGVRRSYLAIPLGL